MKTQSEELSENMVPLLVAENLLTEEDGTRLSKRIAGGNMKAGDWLLAVEKAMEKEASK